ncbi:hypothetical protein HPB47_026474 [Ixodes persulcatus]|uniref:Uncharacterized protein n=1 Tax=Ixodes persulcatus TaxID=34615 RepID=A0AC60PYK8_IXOPE|nr:hypothetical protein HPB47_026474 [Ixodes persulcatus]
MVGQYPVRRAGERSQAPPPGYRALDLLHDLHRGRVTNWTWLALVLWLIDFQPNRWRSRSSGRRGGRDRAQLDWFVRLKIAVACSWIGSQPPLRSILREDGDDGSAGSEQHRPSVAPPVGRGAHRRPTRQESRRVHEVRRPVQRPRRRLRSTHTRPLDGALIRKPKGRSASPGRRPGGGRTSLRGPMMGHLLSEPDVSERDPPGYHLRPRFVVSAMPCLRWQRPAARLHRMDGRYTRDDPGPPLVSAEGGDSS